jgi:S1-C subfamily serine protease
MPSPSSRIPALLVLLLLVSLLAPHLRAHVALLIPPASASPREGAQLDLAEARRAVVFIQALKSRSHGRKALVDGYISGSGFLVTPSGHVLTNAHVVADGEVKRQGVTYREELKGVWITVNSGTDDAKTWKAAVQAADRERDLALLKIEGLSQNTPYLLLGDSDRLEVTDTVYVLCYPFGQKLNLGEQAKGPELTVAKGNVTAIRRQKGKTGLVRSERILQLDVAAAPGASGSPILSRTGAVVGVFFAYLTENARFQFGIPSKDVIAFLDKVNKTYILPERPPRRRRKAPPVSPLVLRVIPTDLPASGGPVRIEVRFFDPVATVRVLVRDPSGDVKALALQGKGNLLKSSYRAAPNRREEVAEYTVTALGADGDDNVVTRASDRFHVRFPARTRIVLKNGSEFEGRIIEESTGEIVLKVSYGLMRFKRDEIERIETLRGGGR